VYLRLLKDTSFGASYPSVQILPILELIYQLANMVAVCYNIPRIVAYMYSYEGNYNDTMAVDSVKITPLAASETSVIDDELCQGRCIHPEHVRAVRRNLLAAEEAARVAALFAVLSDPTRLQVVYALLNAPTGELCVCDLATGLGRDDTTISHQLRVLRSHHIVTMRKAGRVVYYRLVDEHVRQLLALGLTHASEGDMHREAQVSA